MPLLLDLFISTATLLAAAPPTADAPAAAQGAAAGHLPLAAEIGIALGLALIWLAIIGLASKWRDQLGKFTVAVLAFAVLMPFLAAFLISWVTAVWFVGFFVFILAGLVLVIFRTGRATDRARSGRRPAEESPIEGEGQTS